MKKLIILLLAACMMVSCALAETVTETETKLFTLFNAHIQTLGGKELNKSRMFRHEDYRIFPCDGFDVIFRLNEDNKISAGAVRLEDESAAADFLLACMSMISMLGDIDYRAYGIMLHEYGILTTGAEKTIPGLVGIDDFGMSRTDNYPAIFSYVNKDLEVRK